MSEPVDIEHKAGLHIFLFCLFFVLLNWPFILVITGPDRGGAPFLYAFAVWAVLVFVMLGITVWYRERIGTPHGDD